MEKPTKLPLDDKLYSLDAEELSFFQEQTGITDETKLKEHIIAVQGKAYKVRLTTPIPHHILFAWSLMFVIRSMDTRVSSVLHLPGMYTTVSAKSVDLDCGRRIFT
jgi:hypothetical protein